jgi:hypothetical protein
MENSSSLAKKIAPLKHLRNYFWFFWIYMMKSFNFSKFWVMKNQKNHAL